MFVFVVTVFQYNQKLEAERIELLFAHQVSAFHTTFSLRVIKHVEINQMLKGFFDSLPFITEKEFATFTHPILKHHNFQALEWISFVPAEQREDFEQSNLMIREPNLANKLVPATDKESYFPITYVQPLAHNQRALGFDISTNPIAFKAVVEAMEMEGTSITAPIQLVQDLDKKTGFVLYSPVYIKGKQVAYFDNNKRPLKGLVASLFRIADEVESSYIELLDVDLQLKIEVGQQIIFDNFRIIYNDPRRFGFFQLIKNGLDLKKRFNHLGPEPFDPNFNLTYVFEFFKGKNKDIKSFLLDQKFV